VFHGTLTWLPPPDSSEAAARSLIERPGEDELGAGRGEGRAQGRNWRAGLASFIAETDRVIAGFMPEVTPLGDAETLTYLHTSISSRRHPVAVPEPIYLDALLPDTPLTGGLEPSWAICICARSRSWASPMSASRPA
jgi:type IV secretion system protein VirB4